MSLSAIDKKVQEAEYFGDRKMFDETMQTLRSNGFNQIADHYEEEIGQYLPEEKELQDYSHPVTGEHEQI